MNSEQPVNGNNSNPDDQALRQLEADLQDIRASISQHPIPEIDMLAIQEKAEKAVAHQRRQRLAGSVMILASLLYLSSAILRPPADWSDRVLTLLIWSFNLTVATCLFFDNMRIRGWIALGFGPPIAVFGAVFVRDWFAQALFGTVGILITGVGLWLLVKKHDKPVPTDVLDRATIRSVRRKETLRLLPLVVVAFALGVFAAFIAR